MPSQNDNLELCRDGVLNVPQACEFLGIRRSRFYELIDAGAFPTIKLGRKRVAPRRALVAYLAEQLEAAGE